jgi:hypothetical protein
MANRKDKHTMANRKDKQGATTHYTENWRSNNTNPSINRGWTQVLWKGKQFLLHMLHL